MAKEINVEEAQDWSVEEAAYNISYLEMRSRFEEAARIRELRGNEEASTAPEEGSDYWFTNAPAKEVAEWVGDDKDRAELALVAETTRDEPRKKLVEKLEKIVNS